MKEKIEPKYMMATTAIHQLGDISSTEPDLCRVSEEDKDNYYGSWVTGLGFFGARFPKETTKELTEAEHEHFSSMCVQLASNPPMKLNTKE